MNNINDENKKIDRILAECFVMTYLTTYGFNAIMSLIDQINVPKRRIYMRSLVDDCIDIMKNENLNIKE